MLMVWGLVRVMVLFRSARDSQNEIVALVVPHHNLVREQRQALLAQAAQRVHPKTIYLISPNHFAAGQGNAITTSRSWKLVGGEQYPDLAVITALQQRGVVTDDPVPFVREHGISNVLPDLQAAWPTAMVVPIILRERITRSETTLLLAAMYATCPDCLVVASVDFSHYQPEVLANLHDVMTTRVLAAADAGHIWDAEVDSPAALAVMIGWGQLHHAAHFVLVNHTNSGTLVGNPEVETTTHIFGWYQGGAAQPLSLGKTFLVGSQVAKLDERARRGIDTVATTLDAAGFDSLTRAQLPDLTNDVVLAGEERARSIWGTVLPLTTVNGSVQFARGSVRQGVLNRYPLLTKGVFLIKRSN